MGKSEVTTTLWSERGEGDHRPSTRCVEPSRELRPCRRTTTVVDRSNHAFDSRRRSRCGRSDGSFEPSGNPTESAPCPGSIWASVGGKLEENITGPDLLGDRERRETPMKTGYLRWCPDQELNLDQRFRNQFKHLDT